MTRFDRRSFLVGAMGAGVLGLNSACANNDQLRQASATGPSLEEIDRAAALPVLKSDGLKSPVIIESIKLLKKENDHFVHVRSKDGAEGVALTNPPREQYLDKILNQLVIPFFIGKDARNLFAILDMLGRIAGKPMGALLGDILRKEVAIYAASGRRDTTPEQEVEYLQKLIAQSGAKAVKFRVGGRMSRNADSLPGRTDKLIPLVRKTLGDAIDIHADSNSSYDAPQAIKVGRMLEEVKAVYFEEPCQFDHLEETKVVTDALTIPVAGGEQEYSDWRFRWMIANRGVDIVQPDLHYYGGMIRSVRVARMAQVAKMPTTVHISGGFGFVYMLHFASCVPEIGRYQEYKLGTERYGNWFDPPITVKDGNMSVPSGPGVGIKDLAGLLKGAKEVLSC
jgi:L-alanine-DL-glutamate epimerase-like enolase superfamily enzyme